MPQTPARPSDHRRQQTDGTVLWLEETVVESQLAARARRRSSVLGAAMIAVGEILEPDKTRVDIEIEAEAPDEKPYDLPFAVDFGDLPDLT